uniref:Uncharacterized protein n=1 Tax=Anguilla anguilla TaxID=7936 RepID=A0A0E9SUE6_ANGAN
MCRGYSAEGGGREIWACR